VYCWVKQTTKFAGSTTVAGAGTQTHKVYKDYLVQLAGASGSIPSGLDMQIQYNEMVYLLMLILFGTK
jgi:hypothetical protein